MRNHDRPESFGGSVSCGNAPSVAAQQGGWNMPAAFTRNTLCGLTQPQVMVMATLATLLDTMPRSEIRLATLTLCSGPSGGYA